jgi:hypothetical protein
VLYKKCISHYTLWLVYPTHYEQLEVV